ncbi:MAG: NAD(P)/FAD-dependent oxidoreductase [Thermoplasmata archaeon]|nr:NAD(P)/FAD-dependent oxidoreductase [Thermoplasmata archaeon]
MKGLVIGAGIGGLLSSELLAKRGLDITLFEMNRGVTQHFTGELTGASTTKIVGEDCVDNRFSKGMVVSLDSKNEVGVPMDLFLLNADRIKLTLLERAEAEGVTVKFGTRVQRVMKGNAVLARNESVQGDLIVGAEGVTSCTAKEHFPDPNYRTLRAIRYKIEGRHGLENDTAHFYIGKRLGMGYLWLYPRSEREFNLGAGSIDKRDLIPILNDFMKSFPGSENWRIASKGGDLIPYSGLRRAFARPGMALVGNAAGQVSCLLGGGVESTLQGAISLAKAVDKEGVMDPSQYMEEFNASYPRVSRGARLVPPILKLYSTGRLFRHIEKSMEIVSEKDVIDFVSEGRYLRPVLKALFLHPIFSAGIFRSYLRVRKEIVIGI